MSMTDTAEYWWGIKNRKPYNGPDYYHIPGLDCGHRHLFEAKYVSDVNCTACKKALASAEFVHNLKSDQQKEMDEANRERSKRLNSIKGWKQKYPNNPDCSCGFVMLERTNKSTGQSFYGCSQYPICKTTISKNNN